MKNRGLVVLVFLFLIVQSVFGQISISGISSNSAVPGTSITLTGSGFNVNVAANRVFFGGVRATVSSATATSLTVVVPTGAAHGPVTVVNTSTQLQASSTTYFTPVFTPSKGSTWTLNDFDPLVAPTANVGLFLVYFDVDGDGKIDILESQTNPGGFRIKRNVSTPGTINVNSFVNGTLITTGQTYLESVTNADMNNDGKLDVIVAGSAGTSQNGTLSIYINNSTPGSISFANPIQKTYNMLVNSTCGGRAGAIKCCDLDKNGWLDVVMANSNYGYGANGNSNCTLTLLGVVFANSNGVLGAQQNVTVSSYTARSSRITQLECADMNNDGKLDLIFGVRSRTYIMKNTSIPNDLTANSFVLVNTSILDGDRMLLVGDLDLDGDMDLGVAGRLSSTTLRLYQNTTSNQSFGFAASLSVTIGDRHPTVNNLGGAVGDITGDGRPELLIGGASPRILLNKITSTTATWSATSFTALTNIALSTNVNALSIVDLDHDGKNDIIGRSGTTGNAIAIRRSNPVPTVSVGELALQYCPGTQLDVPFITTYSVNAGNTYTVQLSSATGSFTNPTVIGSLSSSATTGIISCVIPANTAAGTAYKIRINASSPGVVGTSNTGNIIINSNVLPTVAITSSQSLICIGTQVVYTATEENGGTAPVFTWKKNGVTVGTNSATYTNPSPANGDVVFAQIQGNAQCTVNSATSNSITLTGVSVVTPGVTITTTQTTICDFTTSVTYSANPVNGGSAPIFQWLKNGVAVGANASQWTDTQPQQGDQVEVQMTSSASCVTSPVVLSNVLTLQYSGATVVPSAAITTSQTNLCVGVNQVVFNATIVNGGNSPTYQWKRNGTNVGNNSSQYVLNNPANNDQIQLVLTSNADCATPTNVNSNTLTLTTQNVSSPAIVISTPQTAICGGSQGIQYTAVATNGGSNPLISWYKNGVLVVQGANTYNNATPLSGDAVHATLLSNASCLTTSTATSNSISIVVNSIVNPTIALTLAQGTNPKCAGTLQQLSVQVTNAGNNPTFTWYRNGAAVNGNSTASFASPSWAVDDIIYCQVVPTNACQSTNLLVTPEFVVDENTPNTFYADADGDGFGDINATASNCGAPAGYVENALDCDDNDAGIYPGNIELCDEIDNNCNVEIDEYVTISFYADLDNDGFGDLTNSVEACVAPAGYVADATDCDDLSVTYVDNDADGFGGVNTTACGSYTNDDCNDNSNLVSPNGVEVCGNGIDEDCSGADFLCVVPGCMDLTACNYNPQATVSNASCVYPVIPSVTIASNDADNSICSGTSVTFTATPTNGGTTPSYQWKLNGANVGTNTSTYTNAALTSGAVVTVVMTANNACQTSAIANGNSITTTVVNNVTPSAAIASSDADNSICSGTSVTFTATPTNGGTTPSYQWKLNGTNVGTNTSTYTNAALTSGAVVTVVMTANNTCQTSATANGNSITTTVVNNVTPSVAIASSDADNSICSGTSVTFTATPTNGGTTPSYQWKLNGANVGTNTSTYTNAALTSGAVVTVVMTANNACQTSATANGNIVTTTVTAPTTWYLDADGDGYYVSSQSSCVSPGAGYTSTAGIQGDCNDNSSAINAGATEICGNNIDEDCSGSDELCLIPGCTAIGACNYDPLATIDDGSCVMPQPEVCNGLDDNCNGTNDEGLTGIGSVAFSTVTTALYPACSTGNISAANLNTGTNSSFIAGNGPDLWYKLSANYNTLRAGLSAAIGDNTLYLFRDLGSCLQQMEMVQLANTGGNQTLFSDELQVGQNYYVVLHGEGGVYNASAKMCFNHLVASSCDHTYSNNTGVYASSCSSFKAQYKANASAYVFNVLSGSQNGTNLNLTPWSFTTTSSSSVVSRIGRIFPANLTGSDIVYQVNVPVVYSIPDALGNLYTLIATGTPNCSVTMSPETSVALRAADRCPVLKTLSSYVTIDRTICAAEKYEWEFSQVLPVAQSPILATGSVNATILFLYNVSGLANGRTYNVRVRPVYYNGTKGAWGTTQCLSTAAAGMAQQSNPGAVNLKVEDESSFGLYPNPSNGEVVQLIWKQGQYQNEMISIWDAQGKQLETRSFASSGSTTLELSIDGLSDGMYFVKCGQAVQRLVICR